MTPTQTALKRTLMTLVIQAQPPVIHPSRTGILFWQTIKKKKTTWVLEENSGHSFQKRLCSGSRLGKKGGQRGQVIRVPHQLRSRRSDSVRPAGHIHASAPRYFKDLFYFKKTAQVKAAAGGRGGGGGGKNCWGKKMQKMKSRE